MACDLLGHKLERQMVGCQHLEVTLPCIDQVSTNLRAPNAVEEEYEETLQRVEKNKHKLKHYQVFVHSQ